MKNLLRFVFFTVFFCSAAFGAGALLFVLNNKSIDFAALEHHASGRPSLVLDDKGVEWARFQVDRREPITYQDMPEHLIQAFVAAEDWAFFQHNGISFKGIIRSALVNLYHGGRVQGASTITQQLVKLLFLDARKTFTRKIKEQLVAVIVEQQCTKQQIMQTYLNNVYFGCGIYGVEAASQRFWGKKAADMSVEESASLAAVVRSPGSYCPLLCPLSAQRRRNVILGQMRKLNFISDTEYDGACAVPLVTRGPRDVQIAPHVREWLRLTLENEFGREVLYGGGLTIQTTLSQRVQREAEKQFTQQFAQIRETINPELDGALISIDVKTGGIKALVGGYDFQVSKFNRALQAKRQMGSVFKPLVYATALRNGASFTDTEIDEPLVLETHNSTWEPRNHDRLFKGEITLAYALSCSNNIVAIKTFLKNNVQEIIDLGKRCRIAGPFHPYPSLALGCVDVTPQEAVGAFNIFANDGVYVEPHCIKWVKDQWGKKIFRVHPERERVLESRIVGQVVKVLTLGLKRVRRVLPQKWVDGQTISKTGTTNDARICWFVGSTPELTTAVCVARDDNKPMGTGVYPLHTAFPIWLGLNRELPLKQKEFVYDPSLREIIIDQKTGERLTRIDRPEAITIVE